MSDKIDVQEALFDRMEGGVSTVNVEDGQIFAFTTEALARLLEAAEASPKKTAIVFVRRPPKERA